MRAAARILGCLLLVSGAAQAQQPPAPPPAPVPPPVPPTALAAPSQTACAGLVADDRPLSAAECENLRTQGLRFDGRAAPVEDHVALRESRIVPGEPLATPPHWTGDVDAGWMRGGEERWEKLKARHGLFAEPFLQPSVLPEVSARVVTVPGARRGSADVDQLLKVSLYWLDLYAPLFTFRGGGAAQNEHFRAILRAPLALSEAHRLSFELWGDLPGNGRLASESGGSTAVGWAMGAGAFAAQARAGVGVDRLLGELVDFRPTFLWDALVSVAPVAGVRLVLQADGRRDFDGGGAMLRVLPGVRFHPLGPGGLTLGASALWWAGTDGGPDGWDTRRIGGLLDVGYLFL